VRYGILVAAVLLSFVNPCFAEEKKKEINYGVEYNAFNVGVIPHDHGSGNSDFYGWSAWINPNIKGKKVEFSSLLTGRLDQGPVSGSGLDGELLIRFFPLKVKSSGIAVHAEGIYRDTGIKDFYKFPAYPGNAEFQAIPLDVTYMEGAFGVGYAFRMSKIGNISLLAEGVYSSFGRRITEEPISKPLSPDEAIFYGAQIIFSEMRLPKILINRIKLAERLSFDYSHSWGLDDDRQKRTRYKTMVRFLIKDEIFLSWHYHRLTTPFFGEARGGIGVNVLMNWK
jgi:hypothetical protein